MSAYARLSIRLLALVLGFLAAPSVAEGAIFRVETTEDGRSGPALTLRQALRLAASRHATEIVLGPGTYVLSPALGELSFLGSTMLPPQHVTIRGAGASRTFIDGGGHSRVFHLASVGVPPIAFTVIGVSIRNGAAPAFGGGGIKASDLSMTLVDSIVEDNQAVEGEGAISFGSTVVSGVALTLVNSVVRRNITREFGSTVQTHGLGDKAVMMVDSTVADNVSTVPSGCGGVGISESRSHLRFMRSTMRDNTADMAALCVFDGADATAENSTISGNVSGGVALGGRSPGRLRLVHTTISRNDGGPALRGFGWISDANLISFQNSLVADNPGGNCRVEATSLVTLGGNLEDADSCGFTGPGDQVSTPAELGPLADNGGPTLTHLPEAASPGVDAAPCLSGKPTDQRGVRRPLGASPFPACDAGSVERNPKGAEPVNLRFHIAETAQAVRPLEKVTFLAFVANAGVSPATAVTVIGYLPVTAQVTTVEVETPQQGICVVNEIRTGENLQANAAISDQPQQASGWAVLREFLCSISGLDAGSAATLAITVIPQTPGVLFVTGRVTSAERDLDPSDNTSTATTGVAMFDLPPTKDACRNGGWQTYDGPGGLFKNQGDCIQFVNTGR